MPVAHGRPLSAVIDDGPLAVDLAVRLAREIAEALAHLHNSGFVHRDVKPENVLVEAGHAVLTDFGLAVPMDTPMAPVRTAEYDAWRSSTASRRRFTAVGKIVGTPYYMSPEALFAEGTLDGRTDIYALGVVLYEMLTGDLPFGEVSPAQLGVAIMSRAVPLVSEHRPDVPRALDDIIARATARNANARYPTADAMAEALASLGIGLNASDNRLLPAMRRRRRVLASASLVGLAALSAAAWSTLREVSLDPHRVVVADLANDTGDSTLNGVGVLAGDIITARLLDDDKLTVVNASVALPSHLQVNLPATDSALARKTRELVTSTRAGLAVTGAYFRLGAQLQLIVEVTDTQANRVLGVAGPVYAVPEHPDSSLRLLGDSVLAILRHAPVGTASARS